eukprot:TRINITY_DN10622_c0_g5_i1.p1 TRINITY_DN10622_c0_g5~~TRINITY_DN10622_c0_g5_i1.p1  ORF type:complete len:795 (-),score=115.71 TRINITY_DN10622_c0_g5_i1:46-2430(-)
MMPTPLLSTPTSPTRASRTCSGSCESPVHFGSCPAAVESCPCESSLPTPHCDCSAFEVVLPHLRPAFGEDSSETKETRNPLSLTQPLMAKNEETTPSIKKDSEVSEERVRCSIEIPDEIDDLTIDHVSEIDSSYRSESPNELETDSRSDDGSSSSRASLSDSSTSLDLGSDVFRLSQESGGGNVEMCPLSPNIRGDARANQSLRNELRVQTEKGKPQFHDLTFQPNPLESQLPKDQPRIQDNWNCLLALFPDQELIDFDDRACEFLSRFVIDQSPLVKKIVSDYAVRKTRTKINNPSAYIVATLIKTQHQIWANQEYYHMALMCPNWQELPALTESGELSPIFGKITNTAGPQTTTNKPQQFCKDSYATGEQGKTLRYTFDLAQYTGTEGLDIVNMHTLFLLTQPHEDMVQQWDHSRDMFEEMLRCNPPSFKGAGISFASFSKYCLKPHDLKASPPVPTLDALLEVSRVRSVLWKEVRPLILTARKDRNMALGERRRVLEVVFDKLHLELDRLHALCVQQLFALDRICIRALVEYATVKATGAAARVADPSSYISQLMHLMRLSAQLTPARPRKNEVKSNARFARKSKPKSGPHFLPPRMPMNGIYTQNDAYARSWQQEPEMFIAPYPMQQTYPPQQYWEQQPIMMQQPQHNISPPHTPFLQQSMQQNMHQNMDQGAQMIPQQNMPMPVSFSCPAHLSPYHDLPTPPVETFLAKTQPQDGSKNPVVQELLGELLYKQVASQPGVFRLTGKITGMLLELPDAEIMDCLLYTSDAADEEDSVDLGGRRIIKKKKKI